MTLSDNERGRPDGNRTTSRSDGEKLESTVDLSALVDAFVVVAGGGE
jgi:hypothetical protein